MNFREQIVSFENDKVFIILSVRDKLVFLFMKLLRFLFVFSEFSESKDIFFIHSCFFQLDILTRILEKMILKSDHMFLIYVHSVLDIGDCVRHCHFCSFFVHFNFFSEIYCVYWVDYLFSYMFVLFQGLEIIQIFWRLDKFSLFFHAILSTQDAFFNFFWSSVLILRLSKIPQNPFALVEVTTIVGSLCFIDVVEHFLNNLMVFIEVVYVTSLILI